MSLREGAEEGLCRGRRRQCLSYHVGEATRELEEEGEEGKKRETTHSFLVCVRA